MLKYITVLICSAVMAQTQTNISELKQISESSHLQFQSNQKKVQDWKLKSKSNSSELKNLIGFTKNFPIFIETVDIDQRTTSNLDLLSNNTIPGVQVQGEGILIHQWDGGSARNTHQEFTDRLTNLEGENANNSNHSTMVASIIIGAGINPQSIGAAPQALLNVYDFYNNISEIAVASSEYPDFLLSNHSYGYQGGWRFGEYGEGEAWYWFGVPEQSEDQSSLYGYYSEIDSLFDALAYNAPNHLIVKAAGNDRTYGPDGELTHYALDIEGEWYEVTAERPKNCMATGYDCIPYGAVAKNILLVGSIDPIEPNVRYESPNQFIYSYFSSRGPVDDGRIKPDVVGVGSGVYIATNSDDDSYYPTGYGTSFSTPLVTGMAALLQQVNLEQSGSYLNASSLKALIINSTNELGEANGPDYIFGWGLVDALKAAQTLTDVANDQAIIYTGEISDEDILLEMVTVDSENISATLVWLDPVKELEELAFNNRNPHLVNDLDLQIIQDSNDALYQSWKLDPDAPSEPAFTGDNTVDNVEKVEVFDREQGNYTIKISAKNSLETPQAFAIVATGLKYRGMSTNNIQNKAKVSIYPNPVTNKLYINSPDNSGSFIRILNANGQIVKSTTMNSFTEVIDVKDLITGSYFVLISNESGIQTEQFIKK